LGDREPRVFILPAGGGLVSASVRLGPRSMPFHFSPASAWGVFCLRGRRYSWIREVSVRGPREGDGDHEAGEGLEAALAAAASPAPGSARPLDTRQVELVRRLLASETRRRRAAADVAATMQQLDSMLQFWRDAPPVPDLAGLDAAELPRPFDFDELPPGTPSPEEGRAELEARIRAELARRGAAPAAWVPGLAGAGLGGVAAGIWGATAGAGALPATLVALGSAGALGVLVRAAQRGLRRRREERLVRIRMDAEWPAQEERASAAWRFERCEWELRRAEARASWRRSELERIARARRLRAGDADAARACLEATLADLDFPFDATCEVAIASDVAYLAVGLPGLADVVPPVRVRVDDTLEVEEVPVSPSERDEAYAEFVAGVALLLGRSAFAAAPALRRALVAAWRPSPGSGAAEYLLDVEVDRAAVAAFDPATVDPDAYLAILPGRFHQREDHRLSALPPPAWLSAAFGPLAAPVAPAGWRN
jgi:hypothetical protein